MLWILPLLLGLTVGTFVGYQIPSLQTHKNTEIVQNQISLPKREVQETFQEKGRSLLRLILPFIEFKSEVPEESPVESEETLVEAPLKTHSGLDQEEVELPIIHSQIIYREHPVLEELCIASDRHSLDSFSEENPTQSEETQTASEPKPLAREQTLQTSFIEPEQEDQTTSTIVKKFVDQGTQTEDAEEPQTPKFIKLPKSHPRVLRLNSQQKSQVSELEELPFSLGGFPSTFSHEIKESSEEIESPIVSSSSSEKRKKQKDSRWVESELINKPSSRSASKKKSSASDSQESSYDQVSKPRISQMTFSVLPDPENSSEVIILNNKSVSKKKSSSSSYEEID